MVSKLGRQSLRLAKANVQTGVDAGLTIAARAQGLASQFGGPAEQAREAQLMVQEKVEAVVEGAFAAQLAWGAFMMKAAVGGVRTPNQLSFELRHIAEAAAAPARRTVRANARRLTGTKAVI